MYNDIDEQKDGGVLMKKVFMVFFFVLFFSVVVNAQDMGLFSNYILKVLSYDRSIPTRTPGGIKISIVYNNKDKNSTQEAVAIAGAMAKLKDKTVQDKPISYSIDIYSDNIGSKLKGYTAVYVCKNVKVSKIIKAARQMKILTLGGSKKYIGKLSVILLSEDGGIKLHIKDKESKKEGTQLAAELKSIAVMH